MSGPEHGLFDPDFCEERCPVCTRARKGIGVFAVWQVWCALNWALKPLLELELATGVS